MAAGRFREDLYYRLNVFPIRIPPLRERRSDIPLLIEAALSRLEERSSAELPVSVAPMALRLLRRHEWPGNVRELFSVVERAAIQADGSRIEVQHLPAELRGPTADSGVPSTVGSAKRYRADSLAKEERSAIRTALEESNGVRAKAAELLGMSRTTLWRKMREYGLRLLVFAALGLSLVVPEPTSAQLAEAGVGTASTMVAQAIETGFLDRSIVVDGVEYLYQVYVPRAYDPERWPAIVVFPQVPEDLTWLGTPGRVAMAALDATLREYRVDDARVYLTGLSLGGNGSWYLAYKHPDRFAALVVVCGFLDAFPGFPRFIPESSADPYPALAAGVASIPVWIVHGDSDDIVPVEESRRMAAALEQAGAEVRYDELPGVDHFAWEPAYASDELAAWLFKQRRP